MGKNTYRLFDKGRKARNRIHKLNYELSEGDLELIRFCGNLAAQIQMHVYFPNLQQKRSEAMAGIEKYCKQLPKRMEKASKTNRL